MAELDVLKQQVAGTIRKFEATGMAAVMKDDYVALHALEKSITEMHLAHAREIDVLQAGTTLQR